MIVVVPDLVESCTEIAVTVTNVVDETTGAVNKPEVEMVPALALHVTALSPVPETVAEHWLFWPDSTVEGEHWTVTGEIGPEGFTVTIVMPDLEVSWVEVTVIVICSGAFPTLGAVNKPDAEIDPALAAQVTTELKLPVPFTVTEHWLVWPYWMVEGEQVTVTEVIVGAGGLLPKRYSEPLQPTNHTAKSGAIHRTSF